MTAEQIAKKYVHGMHDALTDNQEIKDMITDIETYAKEYHEAKLKLLGIGDVSQQRELLAFRKWQKDNWKDVYLYSDEFMISEFKKANCG